MGDLIQNYHNLEMAFHMSAAAPKSKGGWKGKAVPSCDSLYSESTERVSVRPPELEQR